MKSKLLLLVFSMLLAYNQVSCFDQPETVDAKKTFLYFAYGSNMQTKRIHKNNPSAKSIAIAKLKDHKLDFFKYVPSWHGCVSTIVPSHGDEVWGVVWELNASDIPHMDRQEANYFAKNITVQTPNGEDLECRTYQLIRLPEVNVRPNELPPDRQPSPSYMNIIIDGAKEHNIPTDYIEFLRSFRVNDYEGASEPSNVSMSQTFLYFAYGSNMLEKRIRHKNPSAKFKCLGKLKNYRMDFNRFSQRWQGALATVVPQSGSEVWGVIWEIDLSTLESLDKQEGAKDNVYLRKNFEIEIETGDVLNCELYLQRDLPTEYFEPKDLPVDRQPSYVYMNVIVTGAEYHKIPADYMKFLKSFPHNGYDGPTDQDRSLLDK